MTHFLSDTLRHRDLHPDERTALQSLGVSLEDSTFTITVTWDSNWRDCFTNDGKPVAWHADWYTSNGTSDPDPSHHTTYGALSDLPALLARVDRSTGSDFDTDHGLHIEVCGWALHFGAQVAA